MDVEASWNSFSNDLRFGGVNLVGVQLQLGSFRWESRSKMELIIYGFGGEAELIQ